jgi:hypothetical protein
MLIFYKGSLLGTVPPVPMGIFSLQMFQLFSDRNFVTAKNFDNLYI